MRKLILWGLFIVLVPFTAFAGNKAYQKLRQYCPQCEPFIMGALTEEPAMAIVVPNKLWKKLSPEEKKELEKKLESLIREAKNNPKYFVLHKLQRVDRKLCRHSPNSMLCALYIRSIKVMEPRDWKIYTGRYYRKSGRVFIDSIAACGADIQVCK